MGFLVVPLWFMFRFMFRFLLVPSGSRPLVPVLFRLCLFLFRVRIYFLVPGLSFCFLVFLSKQDGGYCDSKVFSYFVIAISFAISNFVCRFLGTSRSALGISRCVTGLLCASIAVPDSFTF